jgi:hypothetical protein
MMEINSRIPSRCSGAIMRHGSVLGVMNFWETERAILSFELNAHAELTMRLNERRINQGSSILVRQQAFGNVVRQLFFQIAHN